MTKIHIKYETKEKAMQINKLINDKYYLYVNCYYVNYNAIEIISNKTNKYKAIMLLADKFNIKRENVYTIGDGYSDIDMIKNFNGYCMEKCVDELKKVSNGKYESVSKLIKDVINEKI